MLHHQVAHFASTASDEEWAAAIARVTELGDYDSDLTVAAMQEGRAQVQAAKSGPDGLKAALQAAVGDTADIRVIRGAEELKQILAGLSDGQPEPETEAGGIRAKAISYL
jgi:hypothetical protein